MRCCHRYEAHRIFYAPANTINRKDDRSQVAENMTEHFHCIIFNYFDMLSQTGVKNRGISRLAGFFRKPNIFFGHALQGRETIG